MGAFWDRFGIILGSFWDRFGIVLGSFWDRFEIILGLFWDHFEIILGSVWDHFGMIWVIDLALASGGGGNRSKMAKCKVPPSCIQGGEGGGNPRARLLATS